MKDFYLSQNGDTNECEILLSLGTKDRDKGAEIADRYINDLLSAISYTRRTYKGSPKFIKSLEKISKILWKTLK